MPICVAGMHRSGTSMVARVLNVCGVYLGSETELLPANWANPDGHWENTHFIRLNEDILAQLGGGWDMPPSAPNGWERDDRMARLRARAEQLIDSFNRRTLWGWKDPRNSLTLPFWQNLIPSLQVVICLRNPLEVAQSLCYRGFSSEAFGLSLWASYNRQLLSALRGQDCIVTHFDTYFFDARSELSRILNLLNINPSEEIVAEACSNISSTSRHALASEHWVMSRVPLEIREMYNQLCEVAGPVYAKARAEVDRRGWLTSSAGRTEAATENQISSIWQLQIENERLERELTNVQLQLAETTQSTADLERWAHGLERQSLQQAETLRRVERLLRPFGFASLVQALRRRSRRLE